MVDSTHGPQADDNQVDVIVGSGEVIQVTKSTESGELSQSPVVDGVVVDMGDCMAVALTRMSVVSVVVVVVVVMSTDLVFGRRRKQRKNINACLFLEIGQYVSEYQDVRWERRLRECIIGGLREVGTKRETGGRPRSENREGNNFTQWAYFPSSN